MTVIKKQDNPGSKKTFSTEGCAAEAEAAYYGAQIATAQAGQADNEKLLAIQILAERAVELVPNEERYLSLAGAIAEKMDEHDKAVDYYERALSSHLVCFGANWKMKKNSPTGAMAHNNLDRAIKKRDQANQVKKKSGPKPQ